ncbi:MAG: DoxX family membrane protein [Nocardioides sp.]|nr:DoxX family membrane protein [Nocardioides sp.]
MKAWSGLVARLVVGAVWIWAGAIKLPDPAASVQAVRAYQLLPSSIVATVGQLLPVVEVVIGVCLVLGVLTRGAGVLSSLLLVAFVVGVASVWARGIEIDCGCFGGGGARAGAAAAYPWEIARDVALLALSAYVAWLPRTRLALEDRLFARPTVLTRPDPGPHPHDLTHDRGAPR